MNPTKAPMKSVDKNDTDEFASGPAVSAQAVAEASPAETSVAELEIAEAAAEAQDHSLFSRSFLFGTFRKWFAKGGLAIVDYGLISGSNFLLGVLLARWLSPRDYGAYALSFSFFILAGFLYQSLLLEPLSVFSGTLFRDNIRGYLKTTLWIHWGLSLVMCLALAIAAVISYTIGHSPVLAIALAGMTIATPFILAHGLARRSFYLKLMPGPAAFGSVFYCVLVVGGVFLFFRLGTLSSFTAFLLMGLAALVTSVVMVIQLNAALAPETGRPRLRATFGKHWEYGRWALATCFATWIPNYFYIPLVSSFSGMAAAGELRALMNLAAPVLQTYAALSMLFLPYAARVQNQNGKRAAAALNGRLAFLFVAGSVAYWSVLIPLKTPLFHFLYNGKYMESAYLIPLFALETTIWSASLGPAILLRAMESPRSLFIANGAASVVAVLIGIPATRYFGLRGVIWSMIGANFLYVVVAFVLFGRKLAAAQAPAASLEKSFYAE
jgi:O-antigen/teichoic acid export membrane protein